MAAVQRAMWQGSGTRRKPRAFRAILCSIIANTTMGQLRVLVFVSFLWVGVPWCSRAQPSPTQPVPQEANVKVTTKAADPAKKGALKSRIQTFGTEQMH